ncbi:CaiB/BaiF CoA transferase family protein [Chloroflexus sp.]|uniref:CaiB/BaiF CoA transferase family protein n=1 Tax=Chloroflexus sp. TaxID=1904827 RepID=UPI0026399A39|nr:CoA transferase [uncultured Chloroflexus sp.]
MLNLSQTLHGVLVVEVASYIPGPLCAAILAGLGATVIKIERPGGDPMRSLPPLDQSGENPLFALLNRSKQCRALNLRQATDIANLRDMLQSADVLIDGLRPGALARLGLTDDSLWHTNPRLLIVSIGGFPSTHAERDQALHDLNAQALSGLLSTGELPPRVPGVHASDMVSGLMAASATLAGLLTRNTTGRGGRIETSMLAAARWLNAPALALALAGLHTADTLNGSLACYRLYQTADGRFLAVAALESHFWQRICIAINRPDLIPLQYEQSAQPTLIAVLATIFRQRSLAEWLSVFAPLDACVSPVLLPTEAAQDGQVGVELAIESRTTA